MVGLDRRGTLKRKIARRSPADFAGMVSRGRWVMADHLDLLNRHLLDVAEGRTTRLLITMPPRHGKSEFASKWFPAWYLGTHPDRRIILASYGAQFAAQWGRKVRDILVEHGPRLFDATIRRDTKAADAWEIAGHGGGMQTCGVGGPLTGKGADVLIIDDPVKNAAEANSETYRESTWDWYTSTAYTRLEPKGAVILIQTRWHEDDLAGRVLAQAKETGEPWTILNLPAIAGDGDQLDRKPGEALWPERYSVKDLEGIKGVLGSYQFSALYGQSPVPDDGGLFRRSWFRYWSQAVPGYYSLGPEGRAVRADQCRRFGTVDLAFSEKKEADYTVIAAWAVTPWSDLILLDLHRERMDAPRLQPSIRAMVEKWGLDYIGIEKVLGQSLVVHGARMDGLTVRSLIADVDKITRSIPAQVRMEAGQVYFPSGHPDLTAIEHELLTFPRGTHDDIVDVVSYGAAEVQRFGPAAMPQDEVDRLAKEAAEAEKREKEERAAQNFDDERYWR